MQKNEDDKCFQQVATVALNQEEIKGDSQRISKIKPFVSKYKNNPTVALDILYNKEKEIYPAST